MKNEYPDNIRDNGRILSINNKLSDILWERIYPHLKCYNNLVPCGFGVEGEWRVDRINECFRFSKYISPSIGFKPHRDAYYIGDINNRFILAILIYLNDDYYDRRTEFYKMLGQREPGQTIKEELENGYKSILTYKPQKGSCLIFNHVMVHLGKPIN